MATTSARRRPSVQALVGGIIVVLGVLLLLDSTGVLETESLVRYVPTLFVLVGVWALVQRGARNAVGPVLVILVAGAWQLVALGTATVDQVVAFWPVFVIALGLSILVGEFRSPARATTDSDTAILAVFGGVERRNTSRSFTRGDLTALFGGAELDLRDAEIVDRPARVNAVALFGGAEIVVPREWNVRMEVMPVLGAASDDRLRTPTDHDEVDLVVTGFAAFGGVTVTD